MVSEYLVSVKHVILVINAHIPKMLPVPERFMTFSSTAELTVGVRHRS
jgi:hypothetical protein